MIESIFAAIIALAVYFIFGNFDILEPYAEYILYVFWGLLAIVLVLAVVTAIATIVKTAKKK